MKQSLRTDSLNLLTDVYKTQLGTDGIRNSRIKYLIKRIRQKFMSFRI